ncbi:VOC family protein [Aquamicrobium soli]|uniref:VOC family protein n=1 Tax=Aquamicrobium soli TaxID=1811518 RepID=A0ABV7K4D9_9HYPH
MAFYVDDIHEAIAYLRANGVRVLGEPVVREEGRAPGRPGSISSLHGGCRWNWYPERQSLGAGEEPAALASGGAREIRQAERVRGGDRFRKGKAWPPLPFRTCRPAPPSA